MSDTANKNSGLLGSVAFLVAFLAMVMTAAQAYVSRDQETRQLRAYVGVQSLRLGFVNGRQIKTYIYVKDYGQTPSYKTTLDWNASFQLQNEKDIYNTNLDLLQKKSSVTIMPQDAKFWELEFDATDVEAKDLEDRNVLVLFGSINYVDAFNNKRNLTFCSTLLAKELKGIDNAKNFDAKPLARDCNNPELSE